MTCLPVHFICLLGKVLILPSEEVASLKAELREQWRIKLQRHDINQKRIQKEDQEREKTS